MSTEALRGSETFLSSEGILNGHAGLKLFQFLKIPPLVVY